MKTTFTSHTHTHTHTHTHKHTHKQKANSPLLNTRFSFFPCVNKAEGTLTTCSVSLQRLFSKLRSTTPLTLRLSKPTIRKCLASPPSWPARCCGAHITLCSQLAHSTACFYTLAVLLTTTAVSNRADAYGSIQTVCSIKHCFKKYSITRNNKTKSTNS